MPTAQQTPSAEQLRQRQLLRDMAARTQTRLARLRELTAHAKLVVARVRTRAPQLLPPQITWGKSCLRPAILHLRQRRLILSRCIFLEQCEGVFVATVQQLEQAVLHQIAHLLAPPAGGKVHTAQWKSTASCLGVDNITPCSALKRW